MKAPSTTWPSGWPKPTHANAIQDSAIEANSKVVVTSSDGRGPMARPNRPATTQPMSGRKTIAWYIAASALHQTDVFDRDRAAVAVIGDENGKPDGGLRGGHGQHDEREHLADNIADRRRERHQVDVDGEQDQLDRHQDDDDVLAVEEDAEDADGEQDRGHREVMGQADHDRPLPVCTLRTSIAVAGDRATWTAIDCPLTYS